MYSRAQWLAPGMRQSQQELMCVNVLGGGLVDDAGLPPEQAIADGYAFDQLLFFQLLQGLPSDFLVFHAAVPIDPPAVDAFDGISTGWAFPEVVENRRGYLIDKLLVHAEGSESGVGNETGYAESNRKSC